MNRETTIRLRVRFSEVDSIRMVWHGNYVQYLEDAREQFGREHNLEYMRFLREGYYAPIVDVHMQYKQVATVNDWLLVKCVYRPTRGGKLVFDYVITRESDGALILEAQTTQLFTSASTGEQDYMPEFFEKWKENENS